MLGERDVDFLAKHSLACKNCHQFGDELSAISDAIKHSRIDSETSIGFSSRVLDEAIRQRSAPAGGMRPALAGALFAFLVVGSTVQFATASPSTDVPDAGSSVEKRDLTPLQGEGPMRFELFDTPSRMVKDPEPFDA